MNTFLLGIWLFPAVFISGQMVQDLKDTYRNLAVLDYIMVIALSLSWPLVLLSYLVLPENGGDNGK